MLDRVLIYTKAPDETGGCPYCDEAKLWLTRKGIPFSEKQLTPAGRQRVYDQLNLVGPKRTVPQVMVIDGMETHFPIGGYDQLVNSGIESLFLWEGF